MRTALFLALSVLTTACGTDRQLRLVSAGATGCRPEAILIGDKQGGVAVQAWTALCGGEAYQCAYANNGDASCTQATRASDLQRGALEDRGRQEAQQERPGPRFEFAHAGEILRGVRATFDVGDTQLTFSFSPEVSRTAVHVRLTVAGAGVPATCTELAFTGASRTLRAPLADARGAFARTELISVTQESDPPTATFCERTWPLGRADVVAFARFAEYVEESLADVSAAAATSPSTADESVVRARLIARGAALRACAGVSEVVSVEATWDANGQLSVRVRGQDDDAVNACARAALGEGRVETQGPGRLIHALEAP